MRRIRRHLTYANVISSLCLFLVLGGGTAVALNGSNTVFSDDIVDNQVYSADVRNDSLSGGGLVSADVRNDTLSGGGLDAPDLRPSSVGTSEVANGSVGTAEVANGSLNDEDVGQGVFNFQGNIGSVPADSCVNREVSGINAGGDHLLLTPKWSTASDNLDYGAQYHEDSAFIVACNLTGGTINDGFTTFNLIVIDAQ